MTSWEETKNGGQKNGIRNYWFGENGREPFASGNGKRNTRRGLYARRNSRGIKKRRHCGSEIAGRFPPAARAAAYSLPLYSCRTSGRRAARSNGVASGKKRHSRRRRKFLLGRFDSAL